MLKNWNNQQVTVKRIIHCKTGLICVKKKEQNKRIFNLLRYLASKFKSMWYVTVQEKAYQN